jgi:monomeric isocitrate dehydrogenase
MASTIRAKSFIADATALSHVDNDRRGQSSMSKLVKAYLATHDAGGSGTDIDSVLSVTSCKLKGDRVFVLVVIEDGTGGG